MKKNAFPCWILTNPRTGSTYLAELLNNTGIFNPRFEEYFTPDFVAAKNGIPVREAKNRIKAQIRSKRLPRYVKIFLGIFNELNLNHKFIKSVHPKIKYIRLRRRDIYANSVSWYIAESTKIWLVRNQAELKGFTEKRVPFNEKRLIEIYTRLKKVFCEWDVHLEDCDFVDVFYEDLVASPRAQINKILTFVGANNKNAFKRVNLIKQTHPQSIELIAKLKKIINED